MSAGCRYCAGTCARYVVYVRDTERNRPATQGIACTSVVACDCAPSERRAALSSGGGGPETKGPATTAQEFARHAKQRGMVHGVHWAIDPTAQVKRLMLRAYPHPGGPLEHLRAEALEALEALERIATPAPERDRYTVTRQGGQERSEGVAPDQVSEEGRGSQQGASERFDAEDWANNYPSYLDGDCTY